MNSAPASSASALGLETRYEQLNRLAGDLYPDRYTPARVRQMVPIASEIRALAKAKEAIIVAHNYVYPELQEVADAVGDSLGLSQYIARRKPRRVEFCGVWFMGETAKVIAGRSSQVYMPDVPGCSLVDAIDAARVAAWRTAHPAGIVISYVNSDAATKAMSEYVCTSGNSTKVLEHAIRHGSGQPILFLPDKYLGCVAMAEARASPDQVDLYDGCCHVHAAIDAAVLDAAVQRHPHAECLVHPECACVQSLLSRSAREARSFPDVHFLSSEQMLHRARTSPSREFIVATEKGMVYRLRRQVPGKTFHPVCESAVCRYMKMNTLEKLLYSLHRDRFEVALDPSVADAARVPIERMLAIH